MIHSAQTEPAGVPAGARNRITRHRLAATDAVAVGQLSRSCADEYGDVADPAFLRELPTIAGELPRAVRRAVTAARLDDHLHATMVSGNPIGGDAVKRTPENWAAAARASSGETAFQLMIYSALVGEVVGWTTQQDGRLVTDVLPVDGMEHSQVSSSSAAELGWHTEDAFSPYRADWVGLLCLRSPARVPTTVSFIDFRSMPTNAVRVLRQPRFVITPDPAHGGGPGPRSDGVARASIISGHPDAPEIRLDRDFTAAAPGDTDAQRALRELIEHVDRNLYDLPLAAGDLCLIDNRNVVRGRRPFQPRFDGADRWLRRVNIVADLRRTRPGRRTGSVRAIG